VKEDERGLETDSYWQQCLQIQDRYQGTKLKATRKIGMAYRHKENNFPQHEEKCIQPTPVRNFFPESAKFKVVRYSFSCLLTPASGLVVALR
jgi:hypothetical protein